MKVALVHHWLIKMRGGEKVLEALADIFPHADIFTLFYRAEGISPKLNVHRVTASSLNKFPYSHRFYPNLLPLYPLGCRTLDLNGYDLILSSDSALVKGVTVPDGVPHICYCHSPPRYLWEMEDIYLKEASFVKRMAAKVTFPWLRKWDKSAAQRVDHFIANSEYIRDRIKRCYGRESEVIYPPVSRMRAPKDAVRGDFFLLLGQLVPYKRPDLAVEAFTMTDRKLIVIGDGPEEKRLKKIAGPNITFMGWQDNNTVRQYLASCRALVFPGEEDFGIVPVEAQMMGRPVIAYGRGGALETVLPGETGLLFREQTAVALNKTLDKFSNLEMKLNSSSIIKHANKFSREEFQAKISRYIKKYSMAK